eukprot:sb/3471644/
MNEYIVIRAMAVLTWVGAALGLINIILNTIAIRVYSRLKPKTYATYYLYICICVADIINGLNSFVTFAIFKSEKKEHKQILCDIIGPVACSTRLTLDLLTILSVGRMVAIAFPFHFRSLFSYTKCSVYVGLFVAFTIVQYLNFKHFFRIFCRVEQWGKTGRFPAPRRGEPKQTTLKNRIF